MNLGQDSQDRVLFSPMQCLCDQLRLQLEAEWSAVSNWSMLGT